MSFGEGEAADTGRLRAHGDTDMTQGVIWKQLLGFAGPMVLGLLFQQMYNTVDTIVVGRFVSKQALAAVGCTSPIINMLVGLCAGLATGAGVVISQCYGARDDDKLHDAVHTTMALSFLLCVFVTIAGVWIVKPMLRLMATPDDVFSQAQEYLTIYFAGVAGLLLYNMGSGILRAVGDSRRPLYFLMFSAALNVFFDLLFVIRFHWGIAGVAYATILSQALSAVLVLWVLSTTKDAYGINWKHLRIRRDMLERVLSIGMPSGLQQAVTAFSNVFVQSYINAFGSSCMAGWASYNKLDIFVVIPVQTLTLSITTFVGQNYGAGRMDRARKGVREAMYMAIGVTILLSAALMLARMPLLSLFNTEPEVLSYGSRFILYISPFYVMTCFNQIYAGALRGIGVAKMPMMLMIFSFVVFRQLYLLVTRLLGGAFVPVALAYPAGWVMCGILMSVAFFRSEFYRPAAKASEAD